MTIAFAADLARMIAAARAKERPRLTGTERAACRLALGVLRQGVLTQPTDSRTSPLLDIDDAQKALRTAARMEPAPNPGVARSPLARMDDAVDDGLDVTHERIIRARLALYLRALLRAGAGDLGPHGWLCPECGWTRFGLSIALADFCDCDALPVYRARRRITPLWERARRAA